MKRTGLADLGTSDTLGHTCVGIASGRVIISMSGAAVTSQDLFAVDSGLQLALQALTVRACMLVLASLAAIATLRWGGVIYRELHRFIVLFRQGTLMLAPCTMCMLCVQLTAGNAAVGTTETETVCSALNSRVLASVSRCSSQQMTGDMRGLNQYQTSYP